MGSKFRLIAVIEKDIDPAPSGYAFFKKHAAFHATPPAETSNMILLHFYDNIAQEDSAVLVPRSEVRLLEQGTREGAARNGPDIEDYVQVVGRSRGGIITRYHIIRGCDLMFADGKQHTVSDLTDLTYDHVRGIWYYSED